MLVEAGVEVLVDKLLRVAVAEEAEHWEQVPQVSTAHLIPGAAAVEAKVAIALSHTQQVVPADLV
jgi:hypothetical protein